MADRLYLNSIKQAHYSLYIDLCGSEERLAQCAAQIGLMSCKVLLCYGEYLSYQREAVGMNTAGLNADHNISCLLCIGPEDLVLVNNAYGEACKVIFVLGIEAGHLGSFAADKRTACLNAAVGNA